MLSDVQLLGLVGQLRHPDDVVESQIPCVEWQRARASRATLSREA
jgi:hypothetical protein